MSQYFCNKCSTEYEKVYEIEFHNIYECPNCKYQKAMKIDDCCRHPNKIVIIDNTKKTKRLLYQCKRCGGIVNKNLPLPFNKFEDQIKDEINIYRFDEWAEKQRYDYLLVKDALEENNYRFSKWGIYNEYLSSKEWRAKRILVLKRDDYKCQACKIASAEEVHHLTYANIYKENLEDLQSVCSNCHHQITMEDRSKRFLKNKK